MGEKSIKVKPRGKFLLLSLSILLIGFGGINSGHNPVILLFSLLLASLATSGLYSRLNLQGLAVDLKPAGRIFCCEESQFLVKIENRTRIPKLALWAEVEGKKFFLGDLAPGKRVEIPLGIAFGKRGVYPLPPIRVFSLFPLGLVERWRLHRPGGTLTVYPKVFRVFPHFPEEFSGQGKLSLWKRGQEELSWLRENPEVELRKMDWKAFARTGKPVEKLFSSNLGKRLIIVLDPLGSGPAFEESVSLIASVGIYLMKKDMEHMVVAGKFQGQVSEKNLDEFLTALALVKPGDEAGSRKLALELRRRFPVHTIFAAVSSPNSPLARILSPKEMVLV